MSSRTIRILYTVLGAILLAALGAWVWRNAHWVEDESKIGFHGEAKRNPLLACERMYTALGLPARSRPMLTTLPPTDALLVLRISGRFLAPTLAQRTLRWVEDGGNLLLLFPTDDDLMELIKSDLEAGRFDMPIASQLGINCIRDRVAEGAAEVDLGHGPRSIALPSRFAFEDVEGVGDILVGERMHARLLSFDHGSGRITLVADDAWATNAKIAENDHAQILWELAQLAGPRTSAMIVFGEEPPGLIVTLAEHAWMALISLGVFIALFLWRASSRFGPVLVDPPRGRRDFIEHVRASGDFLWRQGAIKTLLDAPRAALRHRLMLRRPDLAEAPTDKLAAELAELSGLEVDRLRRALALEQTIQAAKFTEVVRDLETVRKAL